MTVQFKSWLKANRRRLGVTQRKLADLTGIGAGRISDFETGRKMPKGGEVQLLYDAMKNIERNRMIAEAEKGVDDEKDD